MKLRRESHHVAKIAILNVQTAFRHTFLYSELECLPCGDPRNLCGNARIRLLATSGEMFQ